MGWAAGGVLLHGCGKLRGAAPDCSCLFCPACLLVALSLPHGPTCSLLVQPRHPAALHRAPALHAHRRLGPREAGDRWVGALQAVALGCAGISTPASAAQACHRCCCLPACLPACLSAGPQFECSWFQLGSLSDPPPACSRALRAGGGSRVNVLDGLGDGSSSPTSSSGSSLDGSGIRWVLRHRFAALLCWGGA
jgi:hypothetical protein